MVGVEEWREIRGHKGYEVHSRYQKSRTMGLAMTDNTAKEMIDQIHIILGEDLTDAEIVTRIREILYGEEEEDEEK